MSKITRICRLIVVLFVAATVSVSIPACARPIGQVQKIEDYGVEINIGQRRSVMEGSRASLRALSRLERRYPKLFFYRVKWAVRTAPGPLSYVESTYDKSHGNISREGDMSPHCGKPVAEFGLDGVTKKDLHLVARRNGSFSDLEKMVLSRR